MPTWQLDDSELRSPVTLCISITSLWNDKNMQSASFLWQPASFSKTWIQGLGKARLGGQLTSLKFGTEVRNCMWRLWWTGVKVMAVATCLTISTISRGGVKINVSPWENVICWKMVPEHLFDYQICVYVASRCYEGHSQKLGLAGYKVQANVGDCRKFTIDVNVKMAGMTYLTQIWELYFPVFTRPCLRLWLLSNTMCVIAILQLRTRQRRRRTRERSRKQMIVDHAAKAVNLGSGHRQIVVSWKTVKSVSRRTAKKPNFWKTRAIWARENI